MRRWWHAYRGLRLGTRLALGLGVLSLVVVFAVVGTVLTAYMRDYLERQLADQMKLVQVVQSKDAAEHGTVRRKPYYGWYTAVYDVSGGSADLRTPAEVPADNRALTALAQTMARPDEDLTRTVRIDGHGPYTAGLRGGARGGAGERRAHGGVEDTVEQLVTVHGRRLRPRALLAPVVLGRRMLRRGLKRAERHGEHRARHHLAQPDRVGRPAAAARGRAGRRPGSGGAADRVQHDAGAHRRLAGGARRGGAAGCAGSSRTPRTSCAPR